MKREYAILFAATGPLAGRNYLADANCLLNSIQKYKLHKKINGNLTVYVLHNGFDPSWDYLAKATRTFNFELIFINISKNGYEKHNQIEYTKRIRYKNIITLGKAYDVVCLLDADMFFVSDEFVTLFELVDRTDKLIGCNEKHKWKVGPETYYEKDGTPIFDKPGKLHSMICNVPSLFNVNKWMDVLEYYNKICFDGYQYKGPHKVGIGDLFAYNIAIHKMNRDKDVVMFPMETMAQVHHTWINPNTYVINDGDHWRSASGDKIYMLHDTKRICKKTFVEDNINKYRSLNFNNAEKHEGNIRKGLQAVQNEWWELNYGESAALKLNEFITVDNNIYQKEIK